MPCVSMNRVVWGLLWICGRAMQREGRKVRDVILLVVSVPSRVLIFELRCGGPSLRYA